MGMIDIIAIRSNPDQPRRNFDKAGLEDLARSILAAGRLHQPITVRPIPPEGEIRYEIVCGERRWRAHDLLVELGHKQFAKIDCRVQEMNEHDRDVVAIVENLQRQDVSPVEEANAFQRMIDYGHTITGVARLIGVDAFRIRERLAITKLDPAVQHMIKIGQLAPTCAVELCKLRHDQQREAIRKGKTWNEIKSAVRAIADREAQGAMFQSAPKATEEELNVMTAMERKIEQVKAMIASGWKDGECQVARKVNPDNARKMAQTLRLVRLHVDRMARDLEAAAVQAELMS